MATTTGKYMSGTVGGVIFRGLTDWTVEEDTDQLDATDANSLGVEQIDGGVVGPRITFSGYWKLTAGPWPGFRTNSIVSTLALYANTNVAAASWLFDRTLVVRCRASAAVRGQIRYEIELRNTENAAGTSAAGYTGPTA